MTDLFRSQEAWLHLPEFEPDETLYSWCARYHRLSGGASAKATAKRLFGHVHGGFIHDFPGNVNGFVERTGGVLGSAEQIIERRTMYRLYARFRPPEAMLPIKACMQTGDSSRLRSGLGLLSSQANSSHPLKLCPDCVASDLGRSSLAYWHLSHQWPTALVCEIHGTALRSVSSNRDKSLTQAAAIVGISIQRVVLWANRYNIPYTRHQRRKTQTMMARAEALIPQISSRKELADCLEVPHRWLTGFLSRNPELHAAMLRRENDLAIQQHREKFLNTLAHHQGVPMHHFKKIAGNGYLWLMKHDREWLSTNLPIMDSRPCDS